MLDHPMPSLSHMLIRHKTCWYVIYTDASMLCVIDIHNIPCMYSMKTFKDEILVVVIADRFACMYQQQ